MTSTRQSDTRLRPWMAYLLSVALLLTLAVDAFAQDNSGRDPARRPSISADTRPSPSALSKDAASRNSRQRVLPFGPLDPHAVTESFLARSPSAILTPRHLAILVLEPTKGAYGDTGTETGVDQVSYAFRHHVELSFRVHRRAAHVQRLIVRDHRGREAARHERGEPVTTVSLNSGTYVFEVHHARAGDSKAPAELVFLRPVRSLAVTNKKPRKQILAIEATPDCQGCDKSNTDLTDHDFSGVNLSRSTFRGANLTRTRFVKAIMVGCDFRSGSGTATQWTGLNATDFTGANLTGARFDGAQLQVFEADFGSPPIFAGATLDSTSWGVLQPLANVPLFLSTHVEGADFSGASLRGATFDTASLDGATFRGATLDRVDFRTTPRSGNFTPPRTGPNTSCQGCNFQGSIIQNTHFEGAFLVDADFTNAKFMGVTFDIDGLENTDLIDGSLAGIDLSNIDLSVPVRISATTSFVGAILSDGVAHGVNLAGQQFPEGTTQFKGQNLAFTNFSGARLVNADLEGVRLDHANLAGAVLTGANLGGRATMIGMRLVGATVDFANLSGANMQGVQAGVDPGSGARATTFKGAFMPAVNLTDADLRSADLSDAHIYADATAQSLLIGTLLDSADLGGAILAGAAFSGSLTDAVFNGAVLVNATFNGADLTNAKFDDAYLQGANLSGAKSLEGASFENAGFSTTTECLAGSTKEMPPCEWHFTEQGGQPVIFGYGATVLGGLTTDGSVVCPNGATGPCSTPESLVAKSGGPFPPVPKCVPVKPKFCNCIPVDQGGCMPPP